ncbi:helix-turn-helix domain-containing protein [Clostridium tagluense]|uniref:helix-turn-helix domain-containing protein n=1 Tax=Clostridium tagluense TaxID=360422 RepID=UPI001CF55AAE|nr:helix-turn-helix transcriptional regulator [Clostridium tagluense]MCB2298885.1 helix-turn-helix domain-containing protein [Clostridium tagluense]
MTLGEKLKKLRIDNGESLKKVETETFLSASYIYRLETGSRTNPSISTLKTLCAYYNISPLLLME